MRNIIQKNKKCEDLRYTIMGNFVQIPSLKNFNNLLKNKEYNIDLPKISKLFYYYNTWLYSGNRKNTAYLISLFGYVYYIELPTDSNRLEELKIWIHDEIDKKLLLTSIQMIISIIKASCR